MSLYGLDFIIDQSGKPWLCEVNGVASGMNGFHEVYGDDRVAEQVRDMLESEHGKITIDDGTYHKQVLRRMFPVQSRIRTVISKIPYLRRRLLHPQVLQSENALTSWLGEDIERPAASERPYETYVGQKSTVLNLTNGPVPHPTVNPIVSEGIASDKFLQQQVLKNTRHAGYCIPSALVGLGVVQKSVLEKICEEHDQFVLKPTLGVCGLGFELLDKERAMKFLRSRGPTKSDLLSSLLPQISKIRPSSKYVEDFVNENDFSFELGLGIIQPFIDSSCAVDGEKTYSCIRAIVCNGSFVDAYKRVSSDPRVNLSSDARAAALENKKSVDSLSEEIVADFEEQCAQYDHLFYKQLLYQEYFDEEGRTSEDQRYLDQSHGIISRFENIADVFTFIKPD